MKTRMVLILTAILILLPAVNAPAEAKSDGAVPFRAYYVVEPTVVYDPLGCGCMIQDFVAQGCATHLGESGWEGHARTYFATFQQVGYYMEFTADNGDQLFGHFSGSGTRLAPNKFGFEGTFWITDGTGRFEGVTGTGRYWGTSGFDGHYLHFDGKLFK